MAAYCKNYYIEWVQETILITFPEIDIVVPTPVDLPEPDFSFCTTDMRFNQFFFFESNGQDFCVAMMDVCFKSTHDQDGCMNTYYNFWMTYTSFCANGETTEDCRVIAIDYIESFFVSISELVLININQFYSWDFTTTEIDSTGNYKFCLYLEDKE